MWHPKRRRGWPCFLMGCILVQYVSETGWMLRHSNLIAFSLRLYPFKSCEAYGARVAWESWRHQLSTHHCKRCALNTTGRFSLPVFSLWWDWWRRSANKLLYGEYQVCKYSWGLLVPFLSLSFLFFSFPSLFLFCPRPHHNQNHNYRHFNRVISPAALWVAESV